MHWRAFAVSMLAAFAFHVPTAYTHNERAVDGVRVTLNSQTEWQGEYGWCSLSAEIVPGRGGISFRCGGAGPFGTAPSGAGARPARRRTLTESETATLRKLYEAAQLFEGGHVGADDTGSDGPFQILMVRSGSADRRAVVLVLTGNPTFSTGPRKALFDWLIHEQQAIAR